MNNHKDYMDLMSTIEHLDPDIPYDERLEIIKGRLEQAMTLTDNVIVQVILSLQVTAIVSLVIGTEPSYLVAMNILDDVDRLGKYLVEEASDDN